MVVVTDARPSRSAWPARLHAGVGLWGRTLALVWVAAPRAAAAMGALMVLQAVVPVATLWASRGVVDDDARAFGLAGPTAGGDVVLCKARGREPTAAEIAARHAELIARLPAAVGGWSVPGRAGSLGRAIARVPISRLPSPPEHPTLSR